jgi:hypothetical protein
MLRDLWDDIVHVDRLIRSAVPIDRARGFMLLGAIFLLAFTFGSLVSQFR